LNNPIDLLIRSRDSSDILTIDPELVVELVDYRKRGFFIAACQSKEFWGIRGPWIAENIREAHKNLSSDAMNHLFRWVPEIHFSPLDQTDASNQ
jgi:hypothetical protein